MSTRSLTHIKSETGDTVCTIYRQCDGYPGGMGADLLALAESGKLVNGYSRNGREFNGMGCFAAQLICSLKKDNPDNAGNVYLYGPDSTDCGEEYVYRCSPKGGKICVEVDQMDGKGFEPIEAVLKSELAG